MSIPYVGTTMYRGPNHPIPMDYLEKVSKARGSCMGCAMLTKDNLIEYQRVLESADLKDIEQLMKTFQGYPMIFYFGNFPKDFSPDDVQPFSVLKAKDGNHSSVIAFIEGDCPDFLREDSKHSPQFNAAHEYLLPKIHQIATFAGQDNPKMLAQMRGPMFKRDVTGILGEGGGTVTLFTQDGSILRFDKKAHTIETPWGWTTDAFGMSFGTAKAVVEEPPKKQGMFANLREKVISPPTKTETPAEVPVQAAPTVAPEKKTTEVIKPPSVSTLKTSTATVVTPPSANKVYPPKDAKSSNKSLKEWYRRVCGALPDDYKNFPGVVPQGSGIAFLDRMERQKAAMDARREPTAQEPVPEKKEEAPIRTPAPEPAKEPVKEPEPTVKEPPLRMIKAPSIKKAIASTEAIEPARILSVEKKSELEDFYLKKIVDRSSAVVPDPTSLQERESKYPSFTQILGVPRKELLTWPRDSFLNLIKDHPEAANLLMMNLLAIAAEVIVKDKEEKTTITPVEKKKAAM